MSWRHRVRVLLCLLPGRWETVEFWEPLMRVRMRVRVKAVFWQRRFCIPREYTVIPGGPPTLDK